MSLSINPLKKLLLGLFAMGPLIGSGQMIVTFAGDGTLGDTGAGNLATAAEIGTPDGCAFDSYGNFYFTDVAYDLVFKVSPEGIINCVAGTSSFAGYNGDGIVATTAELNTPTGIALDKQNNIYIADKDNNRIRKIEALSGIISTIAGNGIAGFSGDNGAATAAKLFAPEDICFDQSGNLYIADAGNNRIRKINNLGIISTIAGTGVNGNTGDGGAATAAEVEGVTGICIDKTDNIFITGNLNTTVRKIDPAGVISTVAGNGSASPTGDGLPATAAGLAVVRMAMGNDENLYISGYTDNDVRMIDNTGIMHTVAGTGIAGFSGDNGPATAAELNQLWGIALDSCDNVYVADRRNSRIRKVIFNPAPCNYLHVNKFNTWQSLNIFPNPTSNILNINNVKTPSTYCLLGVIGQLVQDGTMNEGDNIISLQHLPTGIYTLEIIDDEQQKKVIRIEKE